MPDVAAPAVPARSGGAARVPTAALAVALVVAWALVFVVQRVALRESGPLWFVAARVAVAAVVLLPLAGSLRWLSARGWATAAVLALTNQLLLLPAQVAGLETVGAGTAATLIYVQPILVAVAAHVLLGETLTGRRMGAVALGFAGVAVLGLREASVGSQAGVLVLLGGAAAFAAGTLVLRATSAPVLGLVVAQHLLAAPPLIVWAAAAEPPPALVPAVVLPALYAGVFGSALAWYLMAVLLRRGAAGVVSGRLFAIPVLAAGLGALLLREPVTAHLVAGVVLVGAALWLLR